MSNDSFEGTDLELRRVLRSLQEGQPAPARARMRLANALVMKAATPFASQKLPPAPPPPATFAKLLTRANGAWMLGGAGAVAIGWAVWVGLAARDVSRSQPLASAPAALIERAPASTTETRAPGLAATSVTEPLPALPVPGASTEARSEKQPPRDASLGAERRLIDGARVALVAGKKAAGVELLTKHARQFPRGVLAEEREALMIDAFVASGRYDEARRRAEAFRARYPGSLFASSVAAALAAIP